MLPQLWVVSFLGEKRNGVQLFK
uniref:Uncharacterized protein n=1 Tax=Arundo donax TaxID=35708 RepID=A0A0A9ARV8_ARUDO